MALSSRIRQLPPAAEKAKRLIRANFRTPVPFFLKKAIFPILSHHVALNHITSELIMVNRVMNRNKRTGEHNEHEIGVDELQSLRGRREIVVPQLNCESGEARRTRSSRRATCAMLSRRTLSFTHLHINDT